MFIEDGALIQGEKLIHNSGHVFTVDRRKDGLYFVDENGVGSKSHYKSYAQFQNEMLRLPKAGETYQYGKYTFQVAEENGKLFFVDSEGNKISQEKVSFDTLKDMNKHSNSETPSQTDTSQTGNATGKTNEEVVAAADTSATDTAADTSASGTAANASASGTAANASATDTAVDTSATGTAADTSATGTASDASATGTQVTNAAQDYKNTSEGEAAYNQFKESGGKPEVFNSDSEAVNEELAYKELYRENKGTEKVYSMSDITKNEGDKYTVIVTSEKEGVEKHGILTYEKDGKYTVRDLDGKIIEVANESEIKLTDSRQDYTEKSDGNIALSSKEYTYEKAPEKYQVYKNHAEAQQHFSPDQLREKIANGEVFIGEVYHSKIKAREILSDLHPDWTDEQIEKYISDGINEGRIIMDPGYGYKDGTYDIAPDETAVIALAGDGMRNRDDIYDGFMHQSNVTQLSGKGQYYQEFGENGEKLTNLGQSPLINNKDLNNIISDNSSERLRTNYYSLGKGIENGSISKNIFGKTNPKEFSELDYIAHYASSGRHSPKDLRLMVKALIEKGFTFNKHSRFFHGTELKKIYDQNKGVDYKTAANKLISDFETLKTEYQKTYDNMVLWKGNARGKTETAINEVLGRFERTMSNIQDRLLPTCEAIEKLMEKLEELKLEDEKLQGEDGQGGLVKEVKDLQDKVVAHKGKIPKKTETYKETNADGQEVEKTRTTTAYKNWESDLSVLEEALKKKVEEEDIQRQKTMELAIDVLEMYFQAQSYMQTFESFKSYFGSGGNSRFVKDPDSIYDNYRHIIKDFADPKKMPVISNLSDYEKGDVIFHDDAYGFTYVVSGKFDPFTGTIQIRARGDDGSYIGRPITIWDQREISPIKPREIPTITPTESVIPPTTTVPPPPTTTVPPPPTTTVPPPPTTTVPPPPTTTVPPPPTTTVPPPPTETIIPPPTRTDIIPDPTYPDPTYPDPTYPDPTYPNPTEITPHTGLGMIGALGAGGANMGALAGVAAGAAGLGLTGMMKDKDKEEEEDKKDKEKDEKEVIEEDKEKNEAIEKYEEFVNSLNSDSKVE